MKKDIPMPNLNKPVFEMFPERKKLVLRRKCPECRKKIEFQDFRCDLSIQEYKISGLCQECMDKHDRHARTLNQCH
jgi:hypothetical protein